MPCFTRGLKQQRSGDGVNSAPFLWTGPETSHMLGKHTATQLHPYPSLLLLSLFMYSACIFEEGTHNAFTEVREELGRVGSLLPPCGIQSSNSGHQGWQQASLFAELSCQVFCILEICYLSYSFPKWLHYIAHAGLEFEIFLPPPE